MHMEILNNQKNSKKQRSKPNTNFELTNVTDLDKSYIGTK